MQEEHDSIMKNDLWNLVLLLKGTKGLGSRWVFKLKHKAYGSINKHKARFVKKGFSQNPKIDYDNIFSPTPWYTTIISVHSLVAYFNSGLH